MLIAVFDFAQVVQPSFWEATPHVQVANRLLNQIPDRATVASSLNLTPHLTGRTTAYVAATPKVFSRGIVPNDWKNANWLIVDTTYSAKRNNVYKKALKNRWANGFVIVNESHGIVLARRVNVPAK